MLFKTKSDAGSNLITLNTLYQLHKQFQMLSFLYLMFVAEYI